MMRSATDPLPARNARRRPSAASRRAGYVIAIAVNAVLLYLLHVRPGWAAFPFLTADFAQVLGILDAALALGLAVNVVYLFGDPPWLTALGSVATSAVSLAVAVRFLQVFPFDVGPGWTGPVRVLLVLALAGTAVALVVALVTLLRALAGRRSRTPDG